MAGRRTYETISARPGEDLEAMLAEKDAALLDQGWIRIQTKQPRALGDVRAVDAIYEEAPRGSEVALRAQALGTASKPTSTVALIIAVAVVVIVLGLLGSRVIVI